MKNLRSTSLNGVISEITEWEEDGTGVQEQLRGTYGKGQKTAHEQAVSQAKSGKWDEAEKTLQPYFDAVIPSDNTKRPRF